MRGGQGLRGWAIVSTVAAMVMMLGLAGVARPTLAAEGEVLNVDVDALGPYGMRGSAVLTDEGDGVSVAIDLDGIGVVGGHPAHLHLGTCDGFDPLPSYPLADVDAAGLSLTKLEDVTIDALLAEPFVVNVHESAAAITTVVACGNLKAAGQTGAAAGAVGGTGAATTGTVDIPAVGVGGALGSDGANLAVVLMLGVLALFLAGAGVTLRRGEGHG